MNFINFLNGKENNLKFVELDKNRIFFNHVMNLLNENTSMFEYKNMPDEIRVEFLEGYLCLNGGCGGGKFNDKYVFCEGGRMGNPDFYGIGEEFTGAFPNGTLSGKIGEDVVFIQNNQFASPDMYLLDTARLLTEIDISILTLIKNSRASKVPIADTEQAKVAIEEKYKQIYAGVPVTVINKKPLEKMLNANNACYEMIDFTDVSSGDRIQHLLKAKDDIMRMYRHTYGHGTNGGFKLAQESVKEVTRDNDTAFIYPNIKLFWRKKGFAEFNRIFGTNIEVDFSESWKIEHDEVLNTTDDRASVSRETKENVSRETKEENGETEENESE